MCLNTQQTVLVDWVKSNDQTLIISSYVYRINISEHSVTSPSKHSELVCSMSKYIAKSTLVYCREPPADRAQQRSPLADGMLRQNRPLSTGVLTTRRQISHETQVQMNTTDFNTGSLHNVFNKLISPSAIQYLSYLFAFRS